MVLLYLCVMKVQLQGILSGVSQAASCSACQYMTQSWLSVAHKLQPLTSAFCLLLLKLKIFFFFFHLRRPCPQQHSSSVIKKSAKLCQIKQMMVGPRCMHACTVHSGVSVFKKKIWKREFVSHKKSILGLKKNKLIVKPLESSSWVAVMFRRGVCVSSSEWHSFMHTAVYVTSGWCFSLPKCRF